MYRLDKLIGTEHELDSVNRTLRDFAQHQRASAVGAVHVTCSDESERGAVESFQHWFAEPLLPELKFWSKSPMRTANSVNGNGVVNLRRSMTPPERDCPAGDRAHE